MCGSICVYAWMSGCGLGYLFSYTVHAQGAGIILSDRIALAAAARGGGGGSTSSSNQIPDTWRHRWRI